MITPAQARYDTAKSNWSHPHEVDSARRQCVHLMFDRTVVIAATYAQSVGNRDGTD